jgi:hypothetical protein
LGVTDAAAVLHILNMPDPEGRRCYALALTEELAAFERPMPVMDEYDLLLKGTFAFITALANQLNPHSFSDPARTFTCSTPAASIRSRRARTTEAS